MVCRQARQTGQRGDDDSGEPVNQNRALGEQPTKPVANNARTTKIFGGASRLASPASVVNRA